MFKGDFEAAKSLASTTSKWIMVTIQDASEFKCHRMIRDLWNNKSVKELIRKNFVFCHYGSSTHQGKTHINFYPVDAYPYFCIIDPLTGERLRVWNHLIEVADFIEQGMR